MFVTILFLQSLYCELDLTLMMTSAQVIEMSVNVTTNSPSEDYTQPDDQNLPNSILFYSNYERQICQ